MNREIYRKLFRRDFSKLLGFDIFEVADDLEYLTMTEWFKKLLIRVVTTPLIQATANIIAVVVDFLEYNPERFPNPMDQYIYIYENQDLILKILARDLKVENPFDSILSYSIWFTLDHLFKRLFRHILTVGQTHKFDPEYVVENILPEFEEPEPDEPAES